MKFAAFQNPAVFELMNKLFGAALPVKVAYRLSKIQKTVVAESEKYNELRRKIIEKYALRTENGEIDEVDGGVKIDQTRTEELVAEMNDLFDIEFDLPMSVTIDDIEKTDLSAFELTILEELGVIKDKEE